MGHSGSIVIRGITKNLKENQLKNLQIFESGNFHVLLITLDYPKEKLVLNLLFL